MAKNLLIPPVSAASPGPLYRQIVDGVKREVSEGRLEPGSPLPSFRSLAEDLMVSIITVKRAYEELEREGIIFRRQGLGTFVSDNGAARSREVKREEAEALLRDALREAKEAGLTEIEFRELFEEIIQNEEE